MSFLDHIVSDTLDGIVARVKTIASGAGLILDDFIEGDVGQQVLVVVNEALYTSALAQASIVRGYVDLDTSTDPGDVDPYDPTNEAMVPRRGSLSDKGAGDYGTERETDTFAAGTWTLVNASGGSVTFAPGALTLTRDTPFAGLGYNPTYRNSPAPSIYTNTDGTVTVANGASLALPIAAETVGISSNATAGHITLTTTLAPTGITGTNGASVLGSGREGAEAYRVRCRQEAALTSPNGPADSYRYLATSARTDGTYGLSTTGTPLGVTRVYVSQDSADGIVDVFIAGPAGGAAVTPALATITTLILTSPGVIAAPDAMTIDIDVADDVVVNVTYTVKVKATSVTGATAGVFTQGGQGAAAPVFTAIELAISTYLETADIGGFNQTAGAGTIATEDLRGVIFGAWPTANTVAVTVPAGSSTALALGQDAIAGTFNGTVTLTA